MEYDDDQLPGFRFFPTEEELVAFYLCNKLGGVRSDLDRVIPVVDMYHYNPWDLPKLAGELCPADGEQWFFFSPRQEGGPWRKAEPANDGGYWKATGSPGDVYSSQNTVIGRKRTMVFYAGRAPGGTKTNWKMNEYKAIHSDEASSSSTLPNPQLREELSLCRVYKKSRSLRTFDRRPPTSTADRRRTNSDAAAALNHPTPILLETTDSSSYSFENEFDTFDHFNWFDLP